MELRHLRYFVAVAEELHFGRAADRLGMAQPPLTRQIQQLEAELGFALIERSRPRIGLTRAGEVLLNHARGILQSVELATREARRTSRGERGRVSVGYPSSLAYSGLTALLQAFRSRFPDVEVELRELPPAEQVTALKAGRLDVAFIRGPLDDAELASELVRREPLVLALPADHRLAAKKRVPLSAVSAEPFVFFPRARAPAFFDVLIGLCRDAGFLPRIAQEAPQVDVLSLVAAGFGISIVPASVRETPSQLVFRPILGAPMSELLMAWRAGDSSPSRHQFVELVRRVGVHRSRAGRSAPA